MCSIFLSSRLNIHSFVPQSKSKHRLTLRHLYPTGRMLQYPLRRGLVRPRSDLDIGTGSLYLSRINRPVLKKDFCGHNNLLSTLNKWRASAAFCTEMSVGTWSVGDKQITACTRSEWTSSSDHWHLCSDRQHVNVQCSSKATDSKQTQLDSCSLKLTFLGTSKSILFIFEKVKEGLWDYLDICVCVSPPNPWKTE